MVKAGIFMITAEQSNTDDIYIREVSSESDLEESLRTVKTSFLTVAKDFNPCLY